MAVSEHLPRESTGVLLRSFISTAFDPRRISSDNRDYDNQASHFKCDGIDDPQYAGKVCVRNVHERACRDARADLRDCERTPIFLSHAVRSTV